MSKKVRADTNAPSGLTISRDGGKFTFAWKISDSDYGAGQWLEYQTNNGAWTGFFGVNVTATSYVVETTPGSVFQIAFRVKGKRKDYTQKVKKKTYKYLMNESGPTQCGWNATVPEIKSFTYARSASNSGSFTWAVDTSDTDTAVFTHVELQTLTTRGNDNPPGSGWSAVSNQIESGSVAYTETLDGSNLVRWARVRAVGPAGASGWSYQYHAYGIPSTPGLNSASAVRNGTSSRITAQWYGPMSLSYPIDTISIQYVIDVPTDTGFTAPATGWSDAITVAANGGSDLVVANVSDYLSTDECMWVRLRAQHDDSSTYSNAVLAQIGTLATPGINATPNVSTGEIAVTIEENTSCAVAATVIFYRSEKRPDYDQFLTIFPPGTTSGTVKVDEIKDPSVGYSTVGAYAFVGSYRTTTDTSSNVTYTLTNVRMRSGIAIDTDILARPPAWLNLTEGTQDNSVRISWPWTWKSANSAELSWADHDDAWESTDEPSTYEIEDKSIESWIIAQLEVGKRWYFRVRLKEDDDEDTITGPWSDMYDYDLSSVPDRPALILSKTVMDEHGSVTARWAYASADNTSQEYADICLATISAGVVTHGNIIAHVGESQTVEITGDWTTGQTYYFCLRVTSTSGQQSAWSDPVPVFIAPPISMAVTEMSLDEDDDLLYLTEMPMTVTVTGAGTSGQTLVSIVRAEDYHILRPDGSDFDGFEGEHIASVSQMGEAQMTITVDDMIGYLDDGAKYILKCTVVDEYGQTASLDYPFIVAWEHQAGKPSAEVTIDDWQKIAIIKPIAPSNYETGDVCDIYRISADKPELVVKGAEFGTKYVDPYPAFGDFCGHRIVTRTANGDYITANNELAWFLADADIGDILENSTMIIDVNGEQITLPYNIELQSQWTKDFKRTTYLGGSVQGDWNPAVTRDVTANTVLLRGRDIDEQLAVRGLAGYAGPAHVRTPDGSSYACDVQVRESYTYQSKRMTYSLAIKVVDPQQPDGMTYAQWQDMHPVD